MKSYTKWGVLLYILFTYPAWGAIATSKPASTSDDYHGLNNNLTTFGGGWLVNYDSTSATHILGLSGAYGSTHAIRFPNINIPQGSTIDSAEWWIKSRCSSCTDTVQLRAAIYNADNGVQVVDTAGFRSAWASRATSSGSIDTAYLRTTVSWAILSYNRLPFNKLDSVIQVVISRAGWVSGNSITLFAVPTAASPANSRAIQSLDNSASYYDSLWVSYTAGGGGSPSATPNVVIRSATLHTTTLRAPERMFYRPEDTWRW